MSDDQHRNRILHPEYKRPPLAELSLAGWNRSPDSQGNIPPPPKKIQRFRDLLHKSLAAELAHPPRTLEAASALLLKVSLASVAITNKINRVTRGQDGWSPLFMSIKAELFATVTMMHEVARIDALHLTALDRQNLIAQAVFRITETWAKKLKRLLICEFRHLPTHNATTCPTCHQRTLSMEATSRWRLCPPSCVHKTAKQVIPHIKMLIHGKERARMRSLLKRSIAKVQQLHDQGRVGRLIRNILSTESPYTLDTLTLPNGSTTDNKHAIHTTVSHYFYDWFKRKIYLNFGFHKPDADIQRLLDDEDFFVSEHQVTNVPDRLLRLAWSALKSPNDRLNKTHHKKTTVRSHMQATLQALPSRSEYDNCLSATGNTTVGGITGLTYSMMKAWEPELADLVFDALVQFWESKTSPEFWNWRWICPKPKVTENVQLSDLRPLVLVEVTRKLWVSITTNRIKALWDKSDLLQHTQHAYRSKHGTDSALIQIINAFEQARETCTDLWISSWDVKRAFDSVDRNVQIAVWLRLGVPRDIANYLSLLDANGKTLIRTPLAQETWHKKGYAGFNTTTNWSDPINAPDPYTCDDPPLTFPCERGTGQGDVSSTLQWNGFYDILLTALSTVQTGKFYTQSTLLNKALPDNAFADDTLSFSSDKPTIQEKADIVSAFSIIFGTDLRADKLRNLYLSYGSEDRTPEEPHTLTVHTQDDHNRWQPNIVPVRTEGEFPHLGVLLCPKGTFDAQFNKTMEMAKQECSTISSRRCCPATKIAALRIRTTPRALYAPSFCNWPLARYTQLQIPFNQAYKKSARLMQSHPNHLLYAPVTEGGLGLTVQLHSLH